MTASFSRRKAFVIVFGMFLVSVLVRLPNLNRPLSDHHEFNTAVILIGLESWEQAGGASRFHFTPILNYQDEGDRWADSTLADAKGNTVYITFGPGWYIFPYIVMKLLYVQPSPILIQVLNLLLHLLSCWILFCIAEILFKKEGTINYPAAIIACLVFLFNPELLWFMGNGYVTTGLALPFILVAIYCMARFLENANAINNWLLTVLFMALFIAIYCDWGGVFVSAMFLLTGWFKSSYDKRYRKLAWISFWAIAAGLGFMFLQFASYLGIEKTVGILFHRFLYRSYGTDNRGIGRLLGWSISFILTRYFPVWLVLAAAWTQSRINKTGFAFSKTTKTLLFILAGSFLLQNLILLNWTAGHDFSVINYSIIFSLVAGTMVAQAFTIKKWMMVIGYCFAAAAIAGYYYFNPPGSISRKGELYDEYRSLGLQMQELVKPGEKIYMNAEEWPQITYYAKRDHTYCNSLEEAIDAAQKNNTANFIWIRQDSGRIIQYKRFSTP